MVVITLNDILDLVGIVVGVILVTVAWLHGKFS